jgi:hypothetical protein
MVVVAFGWYESEERVDNIAGERSTYPEFQFEI